MTHHQTKTTAISSLSSALIAMAMIFSITQTAEAVMCSGDVGLVTCSGGQGNTPNPSIGGTPGSISEPSRGEGEFDGDDSPED